MGWYENSKPVCVDNVKGTCKTLPLYYSFEPYEIGAAIPILQMRQLRFEELNIDQNNLTSRGQNQRS